MNDSVFHSRHSKKDPKNVTGCKYWVFLNATREGAKGGLNNRNYPAKQHVRATRRVRDHAAGQTYTKEELLSMRLMVQNEPYT